MSLLAPLAPSGAAGQEGGPAELRLRPGDAVRIAVKADPQAGGEFPVTDGGVILVPAVGIVRVAGRPFGEVEAEIRRAFARELRDPELLVMPLVRVAVLGEVIRPGLYPVDPTLTAGDVIALAGGLRPTADEDAVELQRGGERRRLDLAAAADAFAVGLESGDRIVVGRRSWLDQNAAIFVSAAAAVASAALTALIVR